MNSPKPRGVIIVGSSRSHGNTYKVASFLKNKTGFDIIDLKDYHIQHFDYEFKNQEDDFSTLIKSLVTNYDTFIFATPVYWYTMSGIMKVFFDRISDCLKIDKDTGRKFRGKSMGSIACSSNHEMVGDFFMPFRASANYLGMNYIGDVFTWIEQDDIPQSVKQSLTDFSATIHNYNLSLS